jgi:hypothetical protein
MPIAGVSDRFIRRTAALRLVQMVAGGSLHDAAQCLGIASAGTAWPGYGIYTGASHVHSGARKQYGPLSFENALEALTRELGNPATPLVNYQARRQALGTWCIDEETWTSITARLPPAPGPQQPDLGDRKRQLASIYVWVQVTSGEHLFAPRPIEAIIGSQGRGAASGPSPHPPFNPYVRFSRIRLTDDLLGMVTLPSDSGRCRGAGTGRAR